MLRLTDRVDRSTWETAQNWERQFWLKEQRQLAKYGKNLAWAILASFGLKERYRGDDHNHWWAGQFENYSFLPSSIANAIEVGCGPYTNIRLVSARTKVGHIFLSDPLIRTYVRFRRTFVRECYDKAFCTLDDHPLEELPYRDEYFDLAIMNNVLDHVKDARECMQNLVRVVKPGGYVVIGQELTNDADLPSHPDGLKIGHPITLDENWFAPYLSHFTPCISKVLSREQGRHPQWHYATLIYAGVKK